MVSSNHSDLVDPILVAFAFGIDAFVHFIAKVELFKTPVISVLVTKLGAISVDREKMGMDTIKTTLLYFKDGEKVAQFVGVQQAEALRTALEKVIG